MLTFSPGSTHALNGLHPFLAVWQKLPACVRHPAGSISSFLRKELWLLEGTDEHAQDRKAILYTGNAPERHYVGKLFFNEHYTHKSLGRRWLWQILFPSKKFRNTCSFNVIQTRWPINRYFRLKNMFCAPNWVFGSVDLKDDFDVFARTNKNAKYTVNKVKKADFKVETTKDPQLFDEFFHKMHQPYIHSRHGECSLKESYRKIKARFSKNGELLFVVEGSQRIAGIMLCFDGKTATAYRLGVRDGDFKWVAKGAISALYYHAIKHCRSRGARTLSLGGSRPFFSDGVLTYKLRNWNMKIDDYSKHFYFLFKPLKTSQFTRDFLCNQPFVSLDKKRMVVNTFCDGDAEEKPDIQALNTQYADKGLTDVTVHYI